MVSFGVRKTVGVKTAEVPLHILQKAKKNHKTIQNNTFAVLFIGASGDTELFEKASNINGFQGGRVANNLYISPFRATVFKTAALFLYLNSSVVIRV